MRRIVLSSLFSVLSVLAFGQYRSNFPWNNLLPGTYTVSTLPTSATGTLAVVTDGNPGCAAGGGAIVVTCIYNGTSWIGVSGLSISATGVSNTIPKFTSASAIGLSSITDNGTTVSTTEAISVGAGTFSGSVGSTSLLPTSPIITAGADATVVNAGEVRRVVYKATVSGTTCISAGGFIAAALNADCVIATFPAKTEITRVIVDNTAGFTCSGTCTGTKTVQVGKSAGGTEYVVAKDATVIATYGLVNADLGASLTTSATTPVGGGDLPSFSATTTIKARYVSGTGNWGNGSTTFVNAGSTTFYIETLVFP